MPGSESCPKRLFLSLDVKIDNLQMTTFFQRLFYQRYFVFLLFCCILLPYSYGKTMDDNNTSDFKVLIIGNSYSRDAFSYVPPILESLSPDMQIEFEILYIGGAALDKHYNNLINNQASFILDTYRSEFSKWISTSNYAVTADLITLNWDLIILQEGGKTALSYEKTKIDIQNIINYIKSYNHDVKFGYMINPTHPVGSENLGSYESDEEFVIISDTARKLKEDGVVNYIIPCGTAIQNARKTYLDNYGDFGHLSYEGRHLQEGVPCWIEAFTAAKVLISQFGLHEIYNPEPARITQKWVKEKKIPGQHGKVIEGRESDYRLAEICALKAISSFYTIENTTVAEIFPEIFKQDRFVLEAHRGFSNEYPENTIISFEHAGMSGVFDAIETDVRQTSDNVLVCMHDATIDRTTNGSGKVNSFSYSELQQYCIDGGSGWDDIYDGFLKIPTFDEYLVVCKKYNLIPYVELKSLTNDGIEDVINTLHDNGFKDGTYVLTSFSLPLLMYATLICDAPVEYMQGVFSDTDVENLCKIRNIVLRPSAKSVFQTYVDKCKEMGIISECYGIEVGNNKQLDSLKSLGVYGGTCNSYRFSSTTNGNFKLIY